jgi:RNA polymerase sigma-70 factor (ECF subfamily)
MDAMAELDDVIARARGGDEAAFAVLFRHFQPPLLRYLRGVASFGVEDIASDVWVDVVRGLGGFTGDEAGFRAWLFTIAHRRVVDAHRSRSRRPETLVSAVPESGSAPDAASDAEERIGTDAAIGLIASLPADQAEVVLLRVVAGLDVTAVASVVGKRAGTVRVLSHRGLKRLAEIMSGHGSETESGRSAI